MLVVTINKTSNYIKFFLNFLKNLPPPKICRPTPEPRGPRRKFGTGDIPVLILLDGFGYR